jgi:UV DNA damage endonuclease
VNAQALEREWARYKYAVLERSQSAYLDIRRMFREGSVPPLTFYVEVERALNLPLEPGGAVNAAQHVWGYFKDCASGAEQRSFQTALERFQAGRGALGAVKRKLYALAEEYHQPYLLESYYFCR